MKARTATNKYRFTTWLKSLVAMMLFLLTTGIAIAQDDGWRPSNKTVVVEYDAKDNSYVKITKIGDMVISREYMTFDEYQEWQMGQLMQQFWDDKKANSKSDIGGEGLLSKIPGFSEISRKLAALDGEPLIKIEPTGTADLTFQGIYTHTEDPSRDVRQRRHFNFDFDENLQLGINAKIGDLFDFNLNWNTQATFDFENKIKLKYEGKEDDILQLFEAADISFPLNTTLIKGSQQLMGFHTKLKFGRLTIDAVLSHKNTSTENMQMQGGASTKEFEIRADEYEENRHYFLAQYFYDNYNKAMSTLPIVNSNIKILRMEVWRTNVGAAVTNNRNLLALTDLGEADPSSTIVTGIGAHTGETTVKPTNSANNLIASGTAGSALINTSTIRSINSVTSYMQGLGLTSGTDYEKIESARLLNSSEYTYNSQLGFISLSQPLASDQMLAVAFQYQVIGDTTVYQVGELTTDGVNDPNTLVVKLLKSTSNNVHSPMWKLMMKNVYFLKSTQLSRENFRFNVLYESPESGVGIGYFTEGSKEGKPLIEVLGLDRMDASMNYYLPDGVFDWMDSAAYKGGTIQANSGRIFFPMVEPFGKDLRKILGDELADQYCFDSLYTMTQTLARQYADKNKFYLEGYYSSSVSGEISLGYSVTQGSVTVTAGGMPLIENVDYTVDYTMGTVRIINESILSSGTPISVSSENNSFSMTTKDLVGAHLDYEFAPEIHLGATFMNLREKALTTKNNFGEEPTSNSIWGLDFNYKHEVPLITKLVDLLPGIQTKAPSTLTFQAEVAQFLPSMANTGANEKNVSYIDDFEGAESSIDLRTPGFWFLASTPQDYSSSMPMFPESAMGTGLAYGKNRALVAWYRIDNLFYNGSSPANITREDLSRPYARRILETEVFPNKQHSVGDPMTVYELNLAYYPSERGPYNYDAAPTQYSAGVNADGSLANPASRWGGIMRQLDYTDFESQNIETIEFWLMDPFMDPVTGEHDDTRTGGKLYFNLGDISEDILRDGRKFFENGMPPSNNPADLEQYPVDTTIWGRVPKTQSIVNAFVNEDAARMYQDIGYDGLGSTNGLGDEQSFFADYLHEIQLLHGTGSQAYQIASNDPSTDNFRYFIDPEWDALDAKVNDRYKYYMNPEGNSASQENSTGVRTQGTSIPNIEDINKDNTLSEAENYYEYAIDLRPEKMQIGQNHIVDIQEATNIQLADGTIAPSVRWYQFSIPIREPDRTVGNLNGFQSIRFMRMFLNEFQDPIILRFATLELVYGTWRKYSESLLQPGDYTTGSDANTSFTLSTINYEENGSRQPVPYVLPPGIKREEWYSTGNSYIQLDEQSVSMDIQELSSGDARAIYRNSQYDLRYYGKMKMFVHAEKKFEADNLRDNDLTLFVRLGSDFTNNYYEYEVPLKFTPWGTPSSDPYSIWPTENNVEIDLTKLVDIKTNRNTKIRSGDLEYNSTMLYSEFVDGHKYTVLGTPNLGKVKVIMIGVRNPKKETLTDGNDMLPKSAIVWVNELRLSEYHNKGGFAAMALARTNLADVGSLSLYGNYTTAGYGNLEDNINKLELINNLKLQSTLQFEVGRFFPEDWGVKIPFYLDVNKDIGSPEYNPLDPDVILKDDLRTYQTKAERDSIKHMTQHRKTTTNLTLTNMHKERTGKGALKPHFYDIENFAFSYAYSGERSSDDDIDHFNKDQHRGGFTYNFSFSQPKQFKPFEKSKTFKGKNWKFMRDFNLYYQPRSFNFATEVYRDREETLLRNKGQALVIINPTYFKQFTWRRDYGFQYDIARSLKFQYDANANARIDEPPGLVETRSATDSIWMSILDGGTMQNFRQNINISWDVPVSKLPYMDFLRMPVTYRTTYNFLGTTQALASQGSTLTNSTTFNATVTGTMTSLYSKFPLLKKANAKRPPKKADDKNKKGKDNDKDKNKTNEKRGLKDSKQTERDAAIADSLRREEIKEMWRQVGYFGLRLATSLKSFNMQANITSGSRVAGYMGEPSILGLDPSNLWTPGLGFVLGSNESIVDNLRNNDLLSRDSLMNAPHQNNLNRVLSLQAALEPIRDMKIDITCTQNYSSNEQFYYKYSSILDMVDGPLSYTMTGSYTTTAWSFRTAFRNSDDLFHEFLDNRMIVAERLAGMNSDSYCDNYLLDTMNGQYYPAGYGANQQTVLLTSFLSAYMGGSASTRSFSPFFSLPLPNWSLNYNGLSKIEFLRKWFTNISISHRYSSTYSIGSFYTDAALSAARGTYDYGSESIINSSGDFIAPVSMEGITIEEQFNPLLKLSVSMVNSLQFNLSIQKNRNLQLSFSNNQLTETTRDGVTFGGGYRFKDVEIHLKAGGKPRDLKSDVLIQLNLTYNNNKTLIRKINQGTDQITSGSQVWTAEISGEYDVSSSITVKAFFQTNINTPYISNSYPNSTTKGGITIRFALQ